MGQKVNIRQHSPAVMEALLGEALQKRHEQKAAAGLRGGGAGQRLCFDVVRSITAAKKHATRRSTWCERWRRGQSGHRTA